MLSTNQTLKQLSSSLVLLCLPLRLERGEELMIGASCTKIVISGLIRYLDIKIIMIHQTIAYFEAF